MKETVRRLCCIGCLLLFMEGASFAALVDTVKTYSARMKKDIRAVVIRPDNYNRHQALPVVYLLHGYGGNYADWCRNAPGFESAADRFNLLIVCPDGGVSSWYWDSPVDPAFHYETYICEELITWIDAHYHTIRNRKGRAITGLSMGGQGALYLAFRHQDIFGAAGSMSGGVDIRAFPNSWDIAKRLGEYAKQPDNWEHHAIVNLLYLLTPQSLQLFIDCGVGDFFYEANESLHRQLLSRNIPHDYITRPGSHNWAYWQQAVQYQLLFMHTFFQRN